LAYRDNYLSVLTAIAAGKNTQSAIARALKAKQGDVSKSLASLLQLGILTKNGIFYEIEDAMLAFWLEAVYQRRRELLVDGTFDKMELFRKEIAAHISNYLRDCEKSATQRMAELFNRFSNELVSIDSKQMRLPHFTKVEINVAPETCPMIAASFRGNHWMVQVHERPVNENDIVNYIRSSKSSGCKVSNKVILALAGIDENAKLLAKELKISIWDSSVANKLLSSYGMKRMVSL